MDTWLSWILLAVICLVALDIFVLVAFFVYVMVKWHKRSGTHGILKEEEAINYDDAVAIQTKQVPVVHDDTSGAQHSELLTSKGKQRKTRASRDFDVPMYFSEVSQTNLVQDMEEVDTKMKPKISVSIHYEVSTCELTVVLIKGKHLISDVNQSNQMHILISAMLMPDGNINHSCKGIPPSPLFKHKFTFEVKHEAIKSTNLKFNIWQVDKYSKKIPFGECTLSLNDALENSDYVELIWLEVEAKDELENETAKGELLASVQYLPGSERINVSVMKGRGLRLEDFDKDIYVKVSSVLNGKVIKNKKTAPAKKSANPLFSETTTFQLSEDLQLENMAIILSMYARRSRGAHKRLIGRCFVGNVGLASPKGQDIWKNMVESPHKLIAEWMELE